METELDIARRRRIEEIRQIMHRDDALNSLVPSDLRIMVGEIDRLRNTVRTVRDQLIPIFIN